MKKKHVKLGKLNLSKSRIASLGESQKIVGGTVGPGCTQVGVCQSNQCPQPTDNCPPATQQFPQCQMTDLACGSAWNPTRCNCVTQQTCNPGDFLCEAGGFGGLA